MSSPHAERLDERLLVRQVREHAQLDLRVVGRDQHVARRGDERAPDLAAELGADRDVLQVRIGAAQAPGGGDRLVEAGVHAPGRGMHQLRQRVDVGALQLVQPAPVENQPRQLVDERQLLEHLHRRRRRSRLAGLLERRQLQLLEQDLAELLRRVDVELLAGQLEDARRAARELALDVLRLRGQRRAVDADAGPFDVAPAPAGAASPGRGTPRRAGR